MGHRDCERRQINTRLRARWRRRANSRCRLGSWRRRRSGTGSRCRRKRCARCRCSRRRCGCSSGGCWCRRRRERSRRCRRRSLWRSRFRSEVKVEAVAAKDVAVIQHKITISECAGAVVGRVQISPRTGKSSQQLQRDQVVSKRLALADDPKNILRRCRRHDICKRTGNGSKRCAGGRIELPNDALPCGIDVASWADRHRAAINACAGALPQQCNMSIISVVVGRDRRSWVVILCEHVELLARRVVRNGGAAAATNPARPKVVRRASRLIESVILTRPSKDN